jgi:hypothetical protein
MSYVGGGLGVLLVQILVTWAISRTWREFAFVWVIILAFNTYGGLLLLFPSKETPRPVKPFTLDEHDPFSLGADGPPLAMPPRRPRRRRRGRRSP